jgi:hypothetical protein
MILADDHTIEPEGRISYAIVLLEGSGYSEAEKENIYHRINNATPDQIEDIITNLELNRVDMWNSYRLKDINRRLTEKGC